MHKEIYLVAGGPSLKDFDFQQLRNEDTIAVNMAAYDVPDPTYCITADSKIFKQLCDGRFDGIDTTWVLVTNPEHCSMKYRNGKFMRVGSDYIYNLFAPNIVIRNAGCDGIGFSFKDFRTGYNSGFCAFQLAVLLGYQRIFLLGFDMQKTHGGHYHSRYKGRQIAPSVLDQFYQNFVVAFDILGKCSEIEVISCSQTSRLNEHIAFVPFEDIPELPPHVGAGISKLEMEEAQRQLDMRKTEMKELIEEVGKSKNPKLSILICSIRQRRSQLLQLLGHLKQQKTDDVEVLVEVDNKEITTGEKRNNLLERARGEYVAFVDDDDHVSPHYVNSILKAVRGNPDCVGFTGHIHFKRRNQTNKFIHSLKYKEWYSDGQIYYRNPNHLNPVKRELALQVLFPHITSGEDKDYSMRLLSLLKTEKYIDTPVMYFYMTG